MGQIVCPQHQAQWAGGGVWADGPLERGLRPHLEREAACGKHGRPVGGVALNGRALRRTRVRRMAATGLSQIASVGVAQGREQRVVLSASAPALLRRVHCVPTRRKASGGMRVLG